MEERRTGLTSTGIKWVALLFMTVDHLGAYGYAIPLFAQHYTTIRILGRIAAPLFLFTVAESVRHTRSKPRLILRYYLAGVGTGGFTLVTNLLFADILVFTPGNILFTFFFTALYIWAIEEIISGVRGRDVKLWGPGLLAILGTLLLHPIHTLLADMGVTAQAGRGGQLVYDLSRALIPDPLNIEYSLIFVLLGILFYFVRGKGGRTAVYLLFCAVCYAVPRYSGIVSFGPFSGFFSQIQYWMILSLPFMLMYNGERGRGRKWLFYVYYPVHRYIIALVAALWG